MTRKARLRAVWPVAGAVWLLLVGLGFVLLGRYESTPGPSASATNTWPEDSKVPRRGPTLVLFAHPNCPCTRASLGELARLLSRFPKPVTAVVVFSAEGKDLRATAADIHGVRVLDDPKGTEARRFGATTSGHTFFYDARGDLRFHGGITGSRGHEGDNAGTAAILAHFEGKSATATTPVFGCGLFTQAEVPRE